MFNKLRVAGCGFLDSALISDVAILEVVGQKRRPTIDKTQNQISENHNPKHVTRNSRRVTFFSKTSVFPFYHQLNHNTQ